MKRRAFVGAAGAALGLGVAQPAVARQPAKGTGTKAYSGAGKFDARGSSGFQWPTEMPDAPRRIRSVSLWVRGASGAAQGGASVVYIDGVNVVLSGPANQPYRIVIVLSDTVEGDWDNLSGPKLKEGQS